ncbi:MAG: hypothetical protein ABF968_13005 [Acetobacter sp.]|uniref:hypothetical protein n=1 Tax=Acetobacter sp. TaxID=440 RepID=UPI0039E7DA00
MLSWFAKNVSMFVDRWLGSDCLSIRTKADAVVHNCITIRFDGPEGVYAFERMAFPRLASPHKATAVCEING